MAARAVLLSGARGRAAAGYDEAPAERLRLSGSADAAHQAAILAETQWGITDPEILSAIRCHTTGKPGMSKLDKIIYLADMTSAERDWPGVDDLRALEMQDLDRALCDALKRSIDFVEEKGGSLDPESVAAYEYAKAHLE